jgi:hypothetical protein
MNTYHYNCLEITSEDLNSCALNYAENYWYDKSNFQRPQSQIQSFFDDFGEFDEDMEKYMILFSEYFTLCEKHRNDPEIRAKYYNTCMECGCEISNDDEFCSNKCMEKYHQKHEVDAA